MIPEEIRPIDRLFHIVATLNGSEGFHSGYMTIESAEAACPELNKKAEELGIKTRYIIKKNQSLT